MFKIKKFCKKTSARTGFLHTSHGIIETPVFMPIGTYAAIKTLSTDEIKRMSFDLVLSNTYHLYLRPGTEILSQFEGLHNFMNWDGAILTDSGGYQIYSLSDFRKISDDGVEFKSHLDGSKHYFTPERIVDIQRDIGSDIMMVLDVCPPADATYQQHLKAVEITTQWAKRCINHLNNKGSKYGFEQIISPIIQGGTSKELRTISANQLIDLDTKMYAIGGLAVGEPKEEMLNTVQYLNDIMPKNKPRYLMGVGTPSDLVESIALGVDMFDCVIPTRNARNGQLFTSHGKINIKNAKYRNDDTMIDENNNSLISKNYSRAYLHHLFKTQEILGYRIATQHNLSFYNNLMINAKRSILDDCFEKWSQKFLNQYNNG
ncbi:MAG: tRNA guanosine(34) transglycosylase Tgt [Candidatus Marinimicrobia bacterium]|nr:tRNA guanosine(34) transglycosylase Tgt [Candidatus Neomarinimicrobiota bacterium]|tara:strand:+ start:99 stop:1220 length:1122 start_codon:yes stop_codon:yes gene_type:complete